MKALDALRTITDLLESQNIAEPQAKARVLVSHVLGEVDFFKDVEDGDWSAMLKMAQEAADGVPVEYITGVTYFRYLELAVSPDVLIPRKETELVAGVAIELIRLHGYKTALDMCTGSGCIAISLAAETGARVSAADISAKAVSLAESNAERNHACVDFIVSDMFGGVDNSYDMIVCNPPYISDDEYESLPADVKKYEPQNALKAADGLKFYRIITKDAPEHINKNGVLVLEIGAGQAQEVISLLEKSGFREIEIRKDYQSRDRIVLAYRG